MKIPRLQPSRLKRAPFFHKKPALVAVVAFAFIGLVVLALSNAATTSVQIEAESAHLIGNASPVNDQSASGGKALQFGTAAPSPTPTPGATYKPLVNPNATQQAKNVYNYLQSIEGKNILSGQHEQDQCTTCEAEWIQSITGKLPVVHGHDMAGYAVDPTQAAIDDWTQRKQIPTFSWHISPPGLASSWDNVGNNFDVNSAVTPGTSAYNTLISQFDGAAQRLQQLEDANVPVLWRPWHEMDGNGCWFWWCKSGPNAYKKLWIMQYDYLVTTKGLNNLIWVWSTSESLPPKYEWYPGNQYVDIVGTDTYHSTSQVSSVASLYAVHKQNAPDKLVALTETNHIPDPAQLKSQGIKIMWFLPWYHSSDNYFEDANNPAYINQVYNSDYVITADEMPDLKTTF